MFVFSSREVKLYKSAQKMAHLSPETLDAQSDEVFADKIRRMSTEVNQFYTLLLTLCLLITTIVVFNPFYKPIKSVIGNEMTIFVNVWWQIKQI